MTSPRRIAISRRLAHGMVVDGPATAGDLAVWLASIGAVATSYPRRDGVSPIDLFAMSESDYAVMLPRDLLPLTGGDRLALLHPTMDRLKDTQIKLLSLGKRSFPALLDYEAMEVVAQAEGGSGTPGTCAVKWLGRPPVRTNETAGMRMPGWILAEAHVDNDEGLDRYGKTLPPSVLLDLDVLAGFRSKYALMLYVRAQAWLSGWVKLPSGWSRRFVSPGRVELRVPVPDASMLLGIEGLKRKDDIERLAFKPSLKELRDAGINVAIDWIRLPGYERVYSHLSVTVAHSNRAETAAPAPKRPRKVKLSPRVARAA